MKTLPLLGLLAMIGFSTEAVQAQDLEPISLNSFSNAPDGVSTAIVEDQLGRTLGIVTRVKLQTNGKLKQFDILMPGGRHMMIDAGSASYDAENHRVIANLPATRTAETDRDQRS